LGIATWRAQMNLMQFGIWTMGVDVAVVTACSHEFEDAPLARTFLPWSLSAASSFLGTPASSVGSNVHIFTGLPGSTLTGRPAQAWQTGEDGYV
jgi:hypothetical protein